MAGTKETRRAVGFTEFSRMFDISRDTAKREAKRGNLRTIRIGSRVLVPISECERVEREGLTNRKNRAK
jgi:hypothetical protein